MRTRITYPGPGNVAFDPALEEIAKAPIPMRASLPPPAGAGSATTFITTFLLTSVAVTMMIALVATAPTVVTVPIGLVFFAYLSATLALSIRRRLRRRRREQVRSVQALDNAFSAWD